MKKIFLIYFFIFCLKDFTCAQTYRRINSNQIEVFSNSNQTDISVSRGTQISITATGTIRLGAFAGIGDADGIGGFTTYNKISDFRHGALLSRVGDGPWFFIGKSGSFVADRDGILSLIVNDKATYDNSGSFIVNYTLGSPQGRQGTGAQVPVAETSKPANQSAGLKKLFRVIWVESADGYLYFSPAFEVDSRNCRFDQGEWSCRGIGYENFRSSMSLKYDISWDGYDGFQGDTFESFEAANKWIDELFSIARSGGLKIRRPMTLF